MELSCEGGHFSYPSASDRFGELFAYREEKEILTPQ